jgi:hypothetical protein
VLNKTDYQIITKYKKKYRANCDLCHADRGYLIENGYGLCYTCAIQERNKRMGISPAPLSDFVVKNGDRYYKTACYTCGADRGYIHKRDITKLCISCSASIRNKKRHDCNNPKIIAHRRLRHSMKSSIARKMRLRGFSKNGESINKILPYSLNDLRNHLELLFKPDMSWDNYGEWEIDHIIPDSWFEYSSPLDSEFSASWSLNNLQPKWKSENRKKSNKFIG